MQTAMAPPIAACARLKASDSMGMLHTAGTLLLTIRDAQYDPDFREALKPRATPFHLLPGQTTTIEVTLIE